MLDTPITSAETRESAAEFLSLGEQMAEGRLSPRFLAEPPFSFSPTSKIFISGSPLPKPVQFDDKRIWKLPSHTDHARETYLALSTPQTLTEAAEALRALPNQPAAAPTARDLW